MATTFYGVRNNAKTTITNNPLTAGGLSITLASSSGSKFPTGVFLATIWDAVTYADPGDDVNMEIVLCDSRSGDTATVNASGRGYAGTTAVEHGTGSAFRILVMREHIDQITTVVNTLESQVVQVESSTTSAYQQVSTVIPFDDSIPQNTEGAEILTVSITPKSASNRILISATVQASGTVGFPGTIALFQDSTANALAAACHQPYATDAHFSVSLQHEMAAGTTGSITFKLRVGPNSGGGVFNVNGSGGARKFGGVSMTSLVVTEMT